MRKKECKNCEQIFEGNFCPNCGQNSHEHRINAHYFLHDIPHSVFHVDAGFFFTLKTLFTKPGVLVENFLEGKRIRYFSPIGFVMVMTALSTFLVKFFDWCKVRFLQHFHPESVIHQSHNFFEHYFSLFIFLMIPFAAVVTNLFFIRSKYNFWEHFLANTYLAAQLNIMWIVMHFVGFIAALVTGKDVDFAPEFFLTVFLMFFLYLYGATFGFLMRGFYKKRILILLIVLMNFVLSILYSYGFNITGIIRN